jgi:hypothetical protein
MQFWHQWPEYIEPGQAVNHQVWTYRGFGDIGDTAGEVTYRIEGPSARMAFEVRYKARGHWGGSLHVQFKDNLETDMTGKRMSLDIGFNQMPGGSSFFLAGKEGNLTSSANWNNDDADKAGWMQSLLPELGRFPLREIILPRSHHAALEDDNFSAKNFGSVKANTVTQVQPIGRQLRREGARVLDTRVMKYDGKFYEAHGTYRHLRWYGGLGETLETVIDEINAFNAKYPGELIIWDFSHETWSKGQRFGKLSRDERNELYNLLLNRLKNRAVLPQEKDITLLPLDGFIKDRTSSVILRFHENWRRATPDTFPGAKEGFIRRRHFPVLGR